jgi:hypothetical protein
MKYFHWTFLKVSANLLPWLILTVMAYLTSLLDIAAETQISQSQSFIATMELCSHLHMRGM